jgi:ribosomal protein S18 acetylase RimI-like enzyme
MIIREALESELPAIRELRINAYREHAQKIPEDHWKVLKRSISSDADIQAGANCLVAEIEGEIVGSVALFPPKTDAYKGLVDELDHPEIRMLCVSEKARGKGVASKLIAECIQRAKAKGFQTIGLHTADFMESAIKLYERLGFDRLPKYDFEPSNDGIIVKAFRFTIQ